MVSIAKGCSDPQTSRSSFFLRTRVRVIKSSTAEVPTLLFELIVMNRHISQMTNLKGLRYSPTSFAGVGCHGFNERILGGTIRVTIAPIRRLF